MNLWRMIFGGGGVTGVIDAGTRAVSVVRGDQGARDEQQLAARTATLGQYAAEFSTTPRGWFSVFVDGLNRLPRPVLAFSTIALFAFAMVDPVAFSARMQGIALIPEPLWWLMGTIVAFYFGAREASHFRAARAPDPAAVAAVRQAVNAINPPDLSPPQPATKNAALEDWRSEAAT